MNSTPSTVSLSLPSILLLNGPGQGGKKDFKNLTHFSVTKVSQTLSVFVKVLTGSFLFSKERYKKSLRTSQR